MQRAGALQLLQDNYPKPLQLSNSLWPSQPSARVPNGKKHWDREENLLQREENLDDAIAISLQVGTRGGVLIGYHHTRVYSPFLDGDTRGVPYPLHYGL